MIESPRSRVAWGLAALMVVTLGGGATIAQSDEGVSPAAIQNINVQKVDGKSAVGPTGDKNKRKGKLMAFSAQGYLPNNVIQKAMDADKLDGIDSTAYATVAALSSTTGAVNEADNPVHWNQIQGVPPNVLAGDATRSFIAGTSPVIAPGVIEALVVYYPVGLDVATSLIPVTDGASFTTWSSGMSGAESFERIGANIARYILFKNAGTVASAVKLRAAVWNDNYLSPSAARDKVRVAFVKDYKKLLKRLGR